MAPPSVVAERFCTGCTQCALDCPYEAILMHRREDERRGLVARVQPDLCVSCGICAGSCAPMGRLSGASVLPVTCAGSLHTSVIEYLVRSGVAGVLIVSCPPRDC